MSFLGFPRSPTRGLLVNRSLTRHAADSLRSPLMLRLAIGFRLGCIEHLGHLRQAARIFTCPREAKAERRQPFRQVSVTSSSRSDGRAAQCGRAYPPSVAHPSRSKPERARPTGVPAPASGSGPQLCGSMLTSRSSSALDPMGLHGGSPAPPANPPQGLRLGVHQRLLPQGAMSNPACSGLRFASLARR